MLTVEPRNDAPLPKPDRIEAGAVEIVEVALADLLANDVDVDGDTLFVASVGEGSGFTASIVGGQLVVARDPRLSGEIVVPFTVSDGTVEVASSVTISVEAINRPPTIEALADIVSKEDVAIEATIPLDAFGDPDGDALTLALTRAGGTAAPDWLAFDPATGRVTGTPPRDFNGTIALAISASDGELVVRSAFDLVVAPDNDLPVLAAPFSDRFAVEDEAFDIELQRDLLSDPDGDDLTIDVRLDDGSALPDWMAFDAGRLALSGTAPADFAGEVGLRVFASDGEAEISDDFVLSFANVNDAPELLRPLADVSTDVDGKAIVAGTAFTFAAEIPAFADVDGDRLGFGATLANGDPLPAWLSFDGTAFTGTAPREAAGTIALRLVATDGELEADGVFELTVEVGNAAPVAGTDAFEAETGTDVRIDVATLLANDADADGDTLTVIAVDGGNGEVALADGVVTYRPGIDFEGIDQFTYTVSDGEATTDGTVEVTVDNPFDVDRADDDGGAQIAGRGRDYLVGGAGTDVQSGGRGQDLLDGGAGNDVQFGGRGADVIRGGTGNDVQFGGRGADTIDGGSGDDIIFGGNGDDVIRGGAGDDLIFGGAGQDTFVFETGDGRDTVMDFRPTRQTRRRTIEGDEIVISVDGIESFAELMALASERNGGVLFDFGNGDELFLRGTRLAALDEDKFSFY